MVPDYTDDMTEPEDGYTRISRKVSVVLGIILLTVAGIGALMLAGV